MRKIIFSTLLFMLSGFVFAHAQFDAKSKAILDKLSAKYQSFNTIEADVTLLFINELKEEQSSQGTLAMERMSGKYLVDLGGHEILNNGKTQWTVLKDQDEIQVTDADKDSQALSPATIFTFYKKGYRGKFVKSTSENNRKLDVIELIPSDQDQNIAKIEMRIDQKTNLIHDAAILDNNGGRLTYTIQNFKVNRSIPYQTFVFNKNKYPNMELVDLR